MIIYLEDYFAPGPSSRQRKHCEVKEGFTLGELLQKLNYVKYEHIILVNGSIKPHHYRLSEEDGVTILPPFLGG